MDVGVSLEITVKDSGLVVHRHQGRLSPGECTLVVEVHNPGPEQRRLVPAALTVLDAAGEPTGAARYVRALVWSDTPTRRRFTTFAGELAPGERLDVRLFYALEGPLPEAALAGKAPLRYRARFGAERDGTGGQVVDGAPFRAQVVQE